MPDAMKRLYRIEKDVIVANCRAESTKTLHPKKIKRIKKNKNSNTVPSTALCLKNGALRGLVLACRAELAPLASAFPYAKGEGHIDLVP